MKIVRIGGKNLASLAGEFSVDFEAEPLASSGLFAICGPTGAGKSTLLDALCLALYGTTPRLPKSARGASTLPDIGGEAVSTVDPRNLLRRGAADAYAEVDFVGNDGLRYRARWSVRRSRNKPGGALQAAGMTLHRLPELAPSAARGPKPRQRSCSGSACRSSSSHVPCCWHRTSSLPSSRPTRTSVANCSKR